MQLLRAYPARAAGGVVETQYLTIDDTGAIPTVLSQPTWLWGAEHGVNARHVAIGNEKIWGTVDPYSAPPALIGMDLVRLGLERGRDAADAIDVMTWLLERHGQGGIADSSANEPYWSSFLVVDPSSAWVLETCGRTWAARPVESGAAISNRLTIRTDWTRASSDVATGADFDSWRSPDAPTGHADRRLEASRAFLHSVSEDPGQARPAHAVAHLRDHGSGPWGIPGSPTLVSEPPQEVFLDGRGVTICMHIRGFQATTSSMVADLPEDLESPARIWAAPASPCASVYVPFVIPPPSHLDPAPMAPALSDEAIARRFSVLRQAVESTPGMLQRVRAGLDGLEATLWDEADGLGGDMSTWEGLADSASDRIVAALDALATGGVGVTAPA
jgi:secernin